jgi:DNA-binding LacI/PurR family transcriptional regulator
MPVRAVGEDRAPVMADVARIAGVSHQTVSRVLNEHPNVRSSTRDRVLAAIRELDYRPNAAARTLVTRRTNTLGVISFNTTLYGPASMLYGIEQAAKQDGYYVTVAVLVALDRRSVLDAVERLREQSVEGIIVIAPQATVVRALASVPRDVPLVAVGCGAQPGLASVAVDNEAGAYRAVSYLLDLGHPTVHHLSGPRSWLDAQEREAGWTRALTEREIEVPPVLAAGDWSARSGFESGVPIARREDVSAVFCANDHMALGLLRALQAGGRRVPQDVSLVGFDDIPEAEYFGPPLTTVRQDFDELGRRALRGLVQLIGDGSPAPSGAAVVPELVVRASAARPTG